MRNISRFLYLSMHPENESRHHKAPHSEEKSPHREEKIDERKAKEWAGRMENEDGTVGPHWTIEQTKQVASQKGITYDPVEFWLCMNMIYSDYFGVAKKLNVNNMDFYVEMSKAFLGDKDAVPGKLYSYFEYIVE